MKRTLGHVALALAFGLLSPLASAQAQTPPAPPSADDAAMAAQKAAFMGLPEATRKAPQEALVWLGLYVGVNDGDFGKHTRDAILAFQASVKAPADGALSRAVAQGLARRRSKGARGGRIPGRERPQNRRQDRRAAETLGRASGRKARLRLERRR